jgi:hypothetical protein
MGTAGGWGSHDFVSLESDQQSFFNWVSKKLLAIGFIFWSSMIVDHSIIALNRFGIRAARGDVEEDRELVSVLSHLRIVTAFNLEDEGHIELVTNVVAARVIVWLSSLLDARLSNLRLDIFIPSELNINEASCASFNGSVSNIWNVSGDWVVNDIACGAVKD